MLALPSILPAPASEAMPGSVLLVAVLVGIAVVVLTSIAVDLRRLRRTSRLRVIHSVMGAAFTLVVLGGTLAVSLALGSAPSATADQPLPPVVTDQDLQPAPVPEKIDTSDITDPATDIQLPTLPLD